MLLDVPSNYTIVDMIRVFIASLLIFWGLAAILYIIWGWVSLIFSWGHEDRVKVGINRIRYSVIWIVVLVSSLFILPKLCDFIGINVSDVLWPSDIFRTVRMISAKVFWI